MTADGAPPPSGARSRVRSLVLARPLLGSTLAVAAVTTIARFNGGVREVLIAREYGTAESLEAFLVAFALVSVMIDALTGAVPSSLIPTIHVRRSDGDRTAEVLGAILPPALGAALVLVVGLAVGSAPVAALIAIVVCAIWVVFRRLNAGIALYAVAAAVCAAERSRSSTPACWCARFLLATPRRGRALPSFVRMLPRL